MLWIVTNLIGFFFLILSEFNSKTAFVMTGKVIMCSSLLSIFVSIHGQVGLFLRSKNNVVQEKNVSISFPSKATEVGSELSNSARPEESEMLHFPIDIDEKL